MINDLVLTVDSSEIMFADDVTFNFSDKSVQHFNFFQVMKWIRQIYGIVLLAFYSILIKTQTI